MMKKSTTDRIYGPGYKEWIHLRDGSAVFFKTLGPEDKRVLAAGFEHLSKESRFRRFFAYKSRLTERELTYFTEVDGEVHFALAAGRRNHAGEVEGLGTARFVRRDDDPGAAELAVAVVDEWQGRGIGRLLLTGLVAAAQERGIRRLVGTVLAENDAMLHLLESAGETQTRWRAGFVEVCVQVDGPAASQRPLHSQMGLAQVP